MIAGAPCGGVALDDFGEVLLFWFGRPSEADYGRYRNVWWESTAAFDREVCGRFLGLHRRAAAGALNRWQDGPRSCLALILLLDQFPRNMFRGRPEAYAADARALAAARLAVERGYDRALMPVERIFVYTPFEHSERLADQREAVRLFESLPEDGEKAETVRIVRRHLEIIERFGRFPHRNKALGRTSTPAEEAFLKEPESSF